MTYQAKVIAGGKVVIPAGFRRELGIKDGDLLVFDRDPSGAMVLRTHAQVAEEVRQAFRDLRTFDDDRPSVVEELLGERREEAQREADKFNRWLAER